MALRPASIYSCGSDVPVYTRIRPGDGPLQTKDNGKSQQKKSKAHAKMGVGQGPTRDQIMKSFARNEPDAWYFTDYLLWWDSLRDPKAASEFMGDLIYFCVALHDSKQKKIRKSWFEKSIKLTRDETFALARRAGKTMHYVACCYKVGGSSHLAQAISDFHEAQKQLGDIREKNNSNDTTTVIDSPVVLHSILLLERIVSRQAGVVPTGLDAATTYWSQMIVPRVIESTFVGPEDPIVGQETDGLLSQENGTVEGELDPDVAYCFSSCGDYPHVLSLLHESMWWSFPGDSDGNKEQNEDAEADGLGQLSDIKGTSGAYIVYASLGKLLKRLPSRTRLNPMVARNTLLASVHLFRRMLERHPILDFDFIVSIHEILVPYLRWASPYCTAVGGLLRCLEAEAISPGASLREWHGRCRPLVGREGVALSRKTTTKSIDTKKKNNPNDSKDGGVSPKLWHRLGSTMMVYYDAGSPLACTNVQLALLSDGMEENMNASDQANQKMFHDIDRLRSSLITQTIDGEYELVPQRKAPASGSATEILGAGINDAYVCCTSDDTLDPLLLKKASSTQIASWWDICQKITCHSFDISVGEGQEWSPEEAYAVKRCRRAALSKLVQTIDAALSPKGSNRTLVPRDVEVAREQEKERKSGSGRTDSIGSIGSSTQSILQVGENHSDANDSSPTHGRSSFSHSVPPLDPRLTISARSMAWHDPDATGTNVSPPPTLTPTEKLLGFDEESTILMSTINAFCQGSADAIEASGGHRSGVVASLLRRKRKSEDGHQHHHPSHSDGRTELEEGEDAGVGNEQAMLRLCTIGSGECVHQFVMAFVRAVSELRDQWSILEEHEKANFQKEQHEQNEEKESGTITTTRWSVLRALLDTCIRIYIVPVGRSGNDLASWLAHRDGWYRRNIFSTFQAQLEYVPALNMPQGPSSLASASDFMRVDAHTRGIVHDDSQPPMCSTLPAALMDYATNARKSLPVTLFSCECWTLPSTTVPGGYGEKQTRYPVPLSELDRKRSTSCSSKTSDVHSRPNSNRIRGSAAPLIVPFSSRIEIGISALLREYADEIGIASSASSLSNRSRSESKDNNSGDDVGSGQHSRSRDAWRNEAICSKEFHAWYNNKMSSSSSSTTSGQQNGSNSGVGVTPYLTIKFTENDMNGDVLPLSQEQALTTNQYIHLSISNCFKYTRPTPHSDITSIDTLVPCSPGTDPLGSSVGLRCVPSTPQLTDMLKKRKWSESDMDTYRETLCGSSLQHHAGIVEVSSIDPQSGFSILIDGALYGPFQKIRYVFSNRQDFGFFHFFLLFFFFGKLYDKLKSEIDFY